MSQNLNPSILLIDSSYPINTRNNKILESLKLCYPQSVIHTVTWNRDSRDVDKSIEHVHIYNERAEYGNPVKKMRYIYGYKRYVKQVCTRINPDIIIASHWDMLLLVYSVKKRNQILIYDNLDVPTSTNKLILYILQVLERFLLQKVDIMIYASRFFRDLYTKLKSKEFLLENKPMLQINEKSLQTNRRFRISYIGNIRYFEILVNLIDAVKELDEIDLFFYGEGMDLEKIKSYSRGCPNIFIKGRYNYNDISQFYLTSDVIWAVYPSDDFNVKYAISNKFHESLFFNIPCIFAKNTKLGEFVEEQHLGFTVDAYSKDCIRSLIISIYEDRRVIEKQKNQMIEFFNKEKSWEEDFNEIKKCLDKMILSSQR